MTAELPQVIHTYQNHTLDSTRWQGYQPRTDDIIITTSYKSGTNWMQEIVRQLIFCGQDVPERDDLWLVAHFTLARAWTGPLDDVLNHAECSTTSTFSQNPSALGWLALSFHR